MEASLVVILTYMDCTGVLDSSERCGHRRAARNHITATDRSHLWTVHRQILLHFKHLWLTHVSLFRAVPLLLMHKELLKEFRKGSLHISPCVLECLLISCLFLCSAETSNASFADAFTFFVPCLKVSARICISIPLYSTNAIHIALHLLRKQTSQRH